MCVVTYLFISQEELRTKISFVAPYRFINQGRKLKAQQPGRKKFFAAKHIDMEELIIKGNNLLILKVY